MNTTDRTVAFLDLTRFTTLTDVHGDQKAAEVIDQFLDAVTAEIDGRGRVVKTLGDGVLLELADPGASIEVADRISHRLHERSGLPELTGGICTGPVVDRGGDILGSTVNLAARLADLAPAGELRVTEDAARAAAEAGWSVEPLGAVEIRGFLDPVELYSVLLCHPSDCVTDPVCGMRLTAGADTPTVRHRDRSSWFCSTSCADRFRAEPSRYTAEPT